MGWVGMGETRKLSMKNVWFYIKVKTEMYKWNGDKNICFEIGNVLSILFLLFEW